MIPTVILRGKEYISPTLTLTLKATPNVALTLNPTYHLEEGRG